MVKRVGYNLIINRVKYVAHGITVYCNTRGAGLFNSGYEYLTNLQYKVKSLTTQISDFKSGEKYVKMQTECKSQLAAKDREIRNLKRELADAHRQVVDVRKIWEQIVDDLEEGHSKELLKKDREIKELKEKVFETQTMLDAEKDKSREKTKELYQVKTELEDEKGKVLKLKAQINRDYENSSLSENSDKDDYPSRFFIRAECPKAA